MEREPIPAEAVLQQLKIAFSAGKPVSLQVTGTSMVPFLRHKKDWVVLEPPRKNARVGQILLFSQGQRLVLHRLRRKKQGYYIMNGDGQSTCETIKPEQVVAVASAVVRRSGKTISCDSWMFRMLGMLWWPTRPFRPQLIGLAEKVNTRRKRSENLD